MPLVASFMFGDGLGPTRPVSATIFGSFVLELGKVFVFLVTLLSSLAARPNVDPAALETTLRKLLQIRQELLSEGAVTRGYMEALLLVNSEIQHLEQERRTLEQRAGRRYRPLARPTLIVANESPAATEARASLRLIPGGIIDATSNAASLSPAEVRLRDQLFPSGSEEFRTSAYLQAVDRLNANIRNWENNLRLMIEERSTLLARLNTESLGVAEQRGLRDRISELLRSEENLRRHLNAVGTSVPRHLRGIETPPDRAFTPTPRRGLIGQARARTMPGPEYSPTEHREGTVVRIAQRSFVTQLSTPDMEGYWQGQVQARGTAHPGRLPLGVLTGQVRGRFLQVDSPIGRLWVAHGDLEFEVPSVNGLRRGTQVWITDEGPAAPPRRNVHAVFANGDVLAVHENRRTSDWVGRIIRAQDIQTPPPLITLVTREVSTGVRAAVGLVKRLFPALVSGGTFVFLDLVSSKPAQATGYALNFVGSQESIERFLNLTPEQRDDLVRRYPEILEYYRDLEERQNRALGSLLPLGDGSEHFSIRHPRLPAFSHSYRIRFIWQSDRPVGAFVESQTLGVRMEINLSEPGWGTVRRRVQSGGVLRFEPVEHVWSWEQVMELSVSGRRSAGVEIERDARIAALVAARAVLRPETIREGLSHNLGRYLAILPDWMLPNL